MNEVAERALAAAVIERAINDAATEPALCESEKKQAYREARLFLLEPIGEWARSRKFWCFMADVEEAALVAAMKKRHRV